MNLISARTISKNHKKRTRAQGAKKTLLNPLAFLLCLTLLLTAAVPPAGVRAAAKNDGLSLEHAITLTQGKTAAVQLTETDTEAFFILSIPSAGKLRVNMQSTTSGDVKCEIYDSHYALVTALPVIKNSGKGTATATEDDYYDAGSYVVRAGKVSMGDSGKISVSYSFSKVNVYDREPNSNIDKAQQLDLNNTYKGIFSKTDKEEWYYVNMPIQGSLKLDFSTTADGTFDIEVYNADPSDKLSRGNSIMIYNAASKKAVSYNYTMKVMPGKYYIHIKAQDGAKAGMYTIRTAAPIKIARMEATKQSVTLKKGKTCQFPLYASPANHGEAITYTSSNKSVATVTASGKITAKKKGAATITATSSLTGKSVKCKVKVK